MVRAVYNEVARWLGKGSRVLDLGSGDGSFLLELERDRNIRGEGVEKNPEMVARCIEKGLVVHQGYILEGLDQYEPGAFDYVLLVGTFEELEYPEEVIREALRVGKSLVIAYSNFAHWRVRGQLMFRGRAPVTRAMPESWYNTPTVRFFSVVDFRDYCKLLGLREERAAFFAGNVKVSVLPNFRAEYGVALLSQ